ncbi:porin [Burkholderia sp. AU15512]|uniref:porin n=1 Tax=Burkholderia sp. AU15512 TaxID=2015345 RepID=UPI000B7A0007|nr:porin [Burkholderia sp. AU15512]OXI19095.1 porin [Burkholderia sp. AU15512]
MRTFAWVALLGALPGIGMAQSSVTLYGQIGGGIRWTNGMQGGSAVGYNNNLIAGNDFGIRGREDLGGGFKALFVLDGSFSSGTGALKTSGTLFSQAAYVGVTGGFGRLTFGRQFNAATDFGIVVDPAGGRGQSLAIEPGVLWSGNPFTLDSRFNNTVKYIGELGGLRVAASYSPGGVAGNTRAGTNFSAAAMYQYQTVLGGASYAKTYSADATQYAQTWMAGGTWQIGAGRLYASYSALDVSSANANRPHRRDKIPALGVVYQATPFLQFTAGMYDDIGSNLGNRRDADGHKLTTYAVVEYFLSKRTEIYAEFDRNGFSGAYRTDPTNIAAIGLRSGGSGMTGASIGLMTKF